MINEQSTDSFCSLIGEKIKSVTFVMNYIQIDFGNYFLSIDTDPWIEKDDKKMEFESREFSIAIYKILDLEIKHLEFDKNDIRMDLGTYKFGITLNGKWPGNEAITLKNKVTNEVEIFFQEK